MSLPSQAWLQGILRLYFCPPSLGLALVQPPPTGRKPRLHTSNLVRGWTYQLVSLTCHSRWWVTVYEKQEFTWQIPRAEGKCQSFKGCCGILSCLHRGEKDKRRKNGKGAKQRSHERSGKNKPASSLLCHCHRPPRLIGLGPLQTRPNPSSSGHLGNLTKQYNFLKTCFIFLP